MKKSIKRLSAILAILVLSMSIAVPVTAVESNENATILYNATYEYYDTNLGITLYYASGHVMYSDGSKYMTSGTVAYLGENAPEPHTYEVYTMIATRNGNSVHNTAVSDYEIGMYLYDEAQANVAVDIREDINYVYVAHAVYDGEAPSGNCVISDDNMFYEGSDFGY